MNRFRKIGIALLSGALLLTGFTSNALALTDACTTISNQASLTYSVGGIPETTPVLSDGDTGTAGIQSTDFLVATKVDLTVAAVNSPVTATGANNVLTFSITNTGNDQQRYGLALYNAATGYDVTGTSVLDNFDMTDTNIRVYLDSDSNYGNGGLTTITNSATLGGTNLGYTAPVNGNNGVTYVHVVADVPAGQNNGDIAAYALRVKTHQIIGRNGGNNAAAASDGGETDESAETVNGCGSAIVLADSQVTGTGPGGAGPGGVTDADRDGDAFAVGYYIVSTAAISVTKSYAVIDDFVNTSAPYQAIPGAQVRYTITITNGSATTAADALVLIDQVPQYTDFFVGSVTAPGGATVSYSTTAPPGPPVFSGYSPTAGANGADAAVNYLRVQIATLAASGTATVTFDALIE